VRLITLLVLLPVVLTASDLNPRILQAGVAVFDDAVQRDDLKGAVLFVSLDGETVLHEAVGWADPESQRKLEKDAVFRMASNTKAVVAAAVLMLQDEGKLSVHDPVRKHLEGWDNYRAGRITIHQLLTHTSGLRIETLFLEPLLEHTSLGKEAERFGEIGAEREPGTSFSYNNPGYNTLGAIVEAVSGQLLADFLRERIYLPLGMKDTSNHESVANHDRMSALYRLSDGKWKRGWSPGDPPDYPFVRASGGMISTASDFARFGAMILNEGEWKGKRLLSKEAVETMTAVHWKDADESYGYGWHVDEDGVFSHGGSDGTWAWVDPNRGIVGLVFTQSPGGKIPATQFKLLVEAAAH